MGLEVRTLRDAIQPAMLIADRRLFLTADRSDLVEEGDPRAAFLLAGRGSEIPPADVQRLSLGIMEGRIVRMSMADLDAKAQPAPPNKARRKGEDK